MRKEIEASMKPEESMKKKYPNLIPNSERSPDELREMGRKGGIKSGESRRRKREQEKHIKMLVQILAERPEVKKRFEELAKIFGSNRLQ